MIPNHNQDGVLPPFRPGSTSANSAAMSPYKVPLHAFVDKFAINEDRVKILNGFLEYRKQLHNAGFSIGFQWLDGSFVENCEYCRKRTPNDIDILTFFCRPQNFSSDEWSYFIKSRPDLFDSEESKKKYFCDAYFVDLLSNPLYIVDQTRYWFGLLSHQRETHLWKGIIEVPLIDNDEGVAGLIDYISFMQEWGVYA